MKTSGVKSLSFHIACPVETCERCSQAIKRVAVITFRDGLVQKVGMDCLERILSGDTSALALFRKNVKLLAKFKADLAILTAAPSEQNSRSYYDRGVYFIADADGKALCHEHYYFHPTRIDDPEGHFDGAPTRWYKGRYCPNTVEQFQTECAASIAEGVAFLNKRITAIEAFLVRCVAAGIAKEAAATTE